MGINKDPLKIIEDVYRDNYSYLKGFLLKLTRDEQLAEDIIQDAFSRILKSPEQVLGIKYLKSWLVTISKHSLIDYHRKKTPNLLNEEEVIESMVVDYLTPEISMLNKEIILEALRNVNGIDKTIFLAKEQLGYTYEEIGLLVNLPTTTIKTRLFRIRKRILENVERSEGHYD